MATTALRLNGVNDDGVSCEVLCWIVRQKAYTSLAPKRLEQDQKVIVALWEILGLTCLCRIY